MKGRLPPASVPLKIWVLRDGGRGRETWRTDHEWWSNKPGGTQWLPKTSLARLMGDRWIDEL